MKKKNRNYWLSEEDTDNYIWASHKLQNELKHTRTHTKLQNQKQHKTKTSHNSYQTIVIDYVHVTKQEFVGSGSST